MLQVQVFTRSVRVPETRVSEGSVSETGASAPALRDVDALQRRLAACQADLQALRQEQATFAHGISHDLRAPLRAIESFAALAAADAALLPATRAHVERVRAAATRTGGLIDALLEFSRAGRAELHEQQVDMGLLAEWSAAELREREPQREAVLEVEPGLHVLGDERLLKLLVDQLLGNAWKFSRDCDCVHIRVGGRRVGQRLQLAVRDTGCGFDMRYVERMFQPFQRLHTPEQGAGHGLGLAIARRIIERHGGRLHARALAEGGSEFGFDLPVAEGA
jgi:signal transduction histidine kinase